MRMLKFGLLLIAALTASALAHEGQHPPEVWKCEGVYQTEPGTPVTPQNRTLILPFGSDKAVMKVDGTDHMGRFEVSGQQVMGWFEIRSATDGQLTEELTLGLATGKLATTAKRADGSRAGIFRGGCQPEPHA